MSPAKVRAERQAVMGRDAYSVHRRLFIWKPRTAFLYTVYPDFLERVPHS